MSTDPYITLHPPYSTIVADPPWPYKEGWPGWAGDDRKRRRPLPYAWMTEDEIADLRVDGSPVCDLVKPEGSYSSGPRAAT